MLQQQDLLGKDSTTLAMVAPDDSGKGDWGVRRKLRKKWRENGVKSEEKWALFESEIERLKRAQDDGSKRWAVGCQCYATIALKLTWHTGGAPVVR